LPGSGPLNGRQAAEIAERHLGRPVKLRSAGRGLLQLAPNYMKPDRYDARKLDLLGPPQMTSYDAGIAQTLAGSHRAGHHPARWSYSTASSNPVSRAI
jgi:hypothetical protein